MTWEEFYKPRMNESYQAYFRQRYSPFLKCIVSYVKGPSLLMEVGCGTGNVTAELHRAIPRNENFYTVHDRCPKMLRLAKKNIKYGPTFFYKNDIVERITCPIYFGGVPKIVHGHGVLEHLTDDQIRSTLAKQLKLGKVVIHYVPSNKYETPSFGDERLMSAEEWQRICNPTKIIPFNDGYDLILIWERP